MFRHVQRRHGWTILVWGAAVLAFAVFSGGCATAPQNAQPKKVALVLGGGGARGFAHVGVIRELENAKIPIDLIVGVSVGSLIGAMYADSANSFTLEWKSFQIDKKEIFDYSVFNLRESLAKGEAIKAYVDHNITARYLEDLKIPLAVVAADLNTGQPVVFQSGPIRDAIRASTSVPGVFPPVPHGNQLLVDGGVLGNLSPKIARDLGAEIVIGVNVSKRQPDFSNGAPNILSVVLESIDIMSEEIVRLNRDRFDVLIEPDVGNVGITDFSRKKELIEAGRAAAQEQLPNLKRLLGR